MTMPYQTFPWSSWIESLKRGEPELFLEGLRKAVFGSVFFRGKNDRDIYAQYAGISQDDIIQNVWLELVATNVIFSYQDAGMSDEDIGARIVTRIRSRIIDAARKAIRHAATFSSVSEDDYWMNVSDGRPSPESDLINKRLINAILTQLSPRQTFILKNFEKFGIGEMRRDELAHEFHISVQMIDKEIRRIKTKIRTIAKDWQLNTTW